MKTYFGTDGIRGRANAYPMTPEVAVRLGMAAGTYFRRGEHRHSVVLGKDTRRSCYMIESALVAGFTAAGMNVRSLGPCPTPAVALLTRSMRADLGVMITASHNGFEDNGIKLFGPDGYKLPDDAELELERLMDDRSGDLAVDASGIGRLRHFEDAKGRYVEVVKSSFPRGLRLDGLKVVLDCANGAAYRVAPELLWELGANIDTIGVSPNGLNINLDCGSTKPEALIERVKSTGADIGIALDGDGDRVIIVDEKGQIVDGDQILARIATDKADEGSLVGRTVVGTVMSNLGFETYLKSKDINLVRTPVGDRHVVAEMRKDGFNVGGEPSGHIILTDHSMTGDGIVAALQVLAARVIRQRPVSEIMSLYTPAPQALRNVRFTDDSPLNSDVVQKAISAATERLNGKGRLLVRPSGTERLIRVMTEGEDADLITQIANDVAGVVERAGTS
jgi:phosphoglucosamine mutase|tara:strand:- start:610 stop:1956 length:1347 start_codon:yes stop_codon:yes gene_type:complete